MQGGCIRVYGGDSTCMEGACGDGRGLCGVSIAIKVNNGIAAI